MFPDMIVCYYPVFSAGRALCGSMQSLTPVLSLTLNLRPPLSQMELFHYVILCE